jgi:hypothetical protein
MSLYTEERSTIGGETTVMTQMSDDIKKILTDNMESLTESMPVEEFGDKLKSLGVELTDIDTNTLSSWQSKL